MKVSLCRVRTQAEAEFLLDSRIFLPAAAASPSPSVRISPPSNCKVMSEKQTLYLLKITFLCDAPGVPSFGLGVSAGVLRWWAGRGAGRGCTGAGRGKGGWALLWSGRGRALQTPSWPGSDTDSTLARHRHLTCKKYLKIQIFLTTNDSSY